jgi:hypothetical protein
MPALFLAAIGSPARQPRIALAAYLLVAPRLKGELSQARLHDTAPQAEHQVEGRFLLDIIVAEGAPVFELLAGENQALLVGRDTLLFLNLFFNCGDRVRGLDIEGYGLAGEGLDENLHSDLRRVSFALCECNGWKPITWL